MCTVLIIGNCLMFIISFHFVVNNNKFLCCFGRRGGAISLLLMVSTLRGRVIGLLLMVSTLRGRVIGLLLMVSTLRGRVISLSNDIAVDL